MVLCVKYRKKLLFEKDRIDNFKNLCLEIGKRYWFEFDALGTDGDHVHIFLEASPKYAPSRVMQIIKSITARELFKQYPEIKKQLWDWMWSDGGYIGTVGDGVTAELIRNYIETQGTTEEKEGYAQMKLFEFEQP